MKYLLILCLTFLVACSENSAGADDFPNAIQALRPDVFDGVNKQTQLAIASEKNLFEIESLETFVALNKNEIALKPNYKMLNTKVAAVDLIQSDTSVYLGDTASLGYMLIVIENQQLTQRQVDSAWIRWDDKAKDTIKNNENAMRFTRYEFKATGRTKFQIVEDADGDSIIDGSKGVDEKLLLIEGSSGENDRSSVEMIISAGPDGKLLGATFEDDNLVLSASQKVYFKDRLIAEKKYIDADQDSILVVGLDSSLVGVEVYKNLLGDLSQDTASVEKVLMWVFDDESKNYPVDYYKAEHLGNYFKETRVVDSLGQKELISDTAWVKESVFLKDSLSESLQTKMYKVLFNPKGDSKNAILKLVWIRRDKEDLTGFKLSVIPLEPLFDGDVLKRADLELIVNTKTENYLMKLYLEEGLIKGNLSDDRGNTWKVDWSE